MPNHRHRPFAKAVIFTVAGPCDYGLDYYNYNKTLGKLFITSDNAIKEAITLIFHYNCKLNYNAFIEDISYNSIDRAIDEINDDDYYSTVITSKDYIEARQAFCEIAWVFYDDYYPVLMERFGNVKEYFECVEIIAAGSGYAIKLHFTELIGGSIHSDTYD